MKNPAVLLAHFVFWFALVGWLAHKYKGRSFLVWGVLGAVFSALPLFVLVFLKPRKAPEEAPVQPTTSAYEQKTSVVSYK